MTDWISWAGGECPVNEDDIIDFKRVMDTEDEDLWRDEQFRAGDVRWSKTGKRTDIVAYRIIQSKNTTT